MKSFLIHLIHVMFLNSDISQFIADSDGMSFYLYNSSFWKELKGHQAGAIYSKYEIQLISFKTYQFQFAQFEELYFDHVLKMVIKCLKS